MKRWYVIQLKHKQELIAEENLDNQGFENYMPVVHEIKTHRGEKINVHVPLFPGYMFVRFDIQRDRWRSISSTKGVYKLLTATDERCTPLPKGFIEDLKDKEDKFGCIATESAVAVLREFVIGDELKVDSGVFTGFTGICQRIRKDRVIILLSLLSGKRALELPKCIVSHLPSA